MSYTTVPQEDKLRNTMTEIIDLFESDKALETIAKTVIPRNMEAPSATWSLCNRLLMIMHGTDDARGYQQWLKSKRQVKKGERAFTILAPRTITKALKDRDGNETEDKVTIAVRFVAVPVFGIEQTDGDALPSLAPPEAPPLMAVASAWNLNVKYQGFLGRYYGYYNGRDIVLATHDVTTFFHELAHAAHERVSGRLKGGQQWDQEIIAEFCGAVLTQLYVPTAINHGRAKEYISGYAETHKLSPAKACLKLLAIADKVLKEIINTATRIEVAA